LSATALERGGEGADRDGKRGPGSGRFGNCAAQRAEPRAFEHLAATGAPGALRGRAFVRLRVAETCQADGQASARQIASTGAGERIEIAIDSATVRVPVGGDARTLERVLAAPRSARDLVRPSIRVFVASQPIDFRKGVHGLVALAADGLAGAPCSGDVFVIRSKRSNRLKILAFDGTGMVLASEWLKEGGFAWPPACEGTMRVTGAQLAMLRVLRAIRPKHVRRAGKEPVVQAAAPAQVVEGGVVTTALLAQIAVAKYRMAVDCSIVRRRFWPAGASWLTGRPWRAG
jgi:transposase